MKKLILIAAVVLLLQGCFAMTFIHIEYGDGGSTQDIMIEMGTATDQKSDNSLPGLGL